MVGPLLLSLALSGSMPMANAAQAPQAPQTCEKRTESRQFDFWIGEWDVYDPQGQHIGHSRVEKLLAGCVIQENWTNVPDNGGGGKSWNYFDVADAHWHQFWLDATGASPARLSGGVIEGAMVLEGPARRPNANGVTPTTRLTFRRTGDKVRQIWEQSTDAGKTWTTVFDGEYRRAGTHS